MKTIQDLVDRLNEFNLQQRKFYASSQFGVTYLKASDSCGVQYRLVKFEGYFYHIYSKFSGLYSYEQKVIIDFLANSNPEDWFAEKKYNIIIGQDNNEEHFTVYRRNFANDGFIIDDAVLQNDLIRKGLIFTESEIEELKSQLPESMSKIVELGKVEVKDD